MTWCSVSKSAGYSNYENYAGSSGMIANTYSMFALDEFSTFLLKLKKKKK